MKWEPIESAPKDGSYVLIWEKGCDTPVVAYGSPSCGWIASQEHYECGLESVVTDNLDNEFITHWMPLPPPPEGE